MKIGPSRTFPCRSTFLRKLSAVASITVLFFGNAIPVNADDSTLPSWTEIETAKSDIQKKQKQINVINAGLDGLSQRVNEISDRALKLSAEYAVSQANLEAIDRKLSDLDLQKQGAQKSITESVKQINHLVTGLFQGHLMAFDIDALKAPDGLLWGLTVMNRYTDNLSNFRDKMLADYNASLYIQQQIEDTRNRQKKIAAEIGAKRSDALQSVEQLKSEIKRKRDMSTKLLTMLAALKGSTLAKERAIRQNEEREAAAKKAAEAARQRAKTNPQVIAIDVKTPGSDAGRGEQNKKRDKNPLYLLATTGIPKREEAKKYAKKKVSEYGWDESEWDCLDILWTRESTWRWNAYNLSSGAYGIPQALPGSKMANVADDWMTNQNTQIEWGLAYITSRYKTPCKAWEFWQKSNWY